MFHFLIITVMCVCLLSCESEKTASYYAEHPKEMKAKMLECREDAAKKMQDPDCINAAQGWNIRFWGGKTKDNIPLSKEQDKKEINPSKQDKKKTPSKGLLLLGQ